MTKDIQQQVEQLTLYRDTKDSEGVNDSSELSSGSKKLKAYPGGLEEINGITTNQIFSPRDLLVGNFPITKNLNGEVLSPIVFLNMQKKQKSKEIFTLKALLDSEATATLINSKFVKGYKTHKYTPTS